MKGEQRFSLHLIENDTRKGRQDRAPTSAGRFKSKRWRKSHLLRKPTTFNISNPPPETTNTLVALGIETLRHYGSLTHQEEHQQHHQGSYSVILLYCITFLGIARLFAPVEPIIFAFLISLDLYS